MSRKLQIHIMLIASFSTSLILNSCSAVLRPKHDKKKMEKQRKQWSENKKKVFQKRK